MWVSIAIAAVVVLAVAWFAVAWVTARLDATPSRAVFDIEAATVYIGENLPDRVKGRLSYDDVRLLLRWEITYFRERGVASFGGVDHVAEDASLYPGPVVADEDELVDELIARARDEGLDADEIDIVCVTDLATHYLRRIGAIGAAVDTAGALPGGAAEALPAGDDPDDIADDGPEDGPGDRADRVRRDLPDEDLPESPA